MQPAEKKTFKIHEISVMTTGAIKRKENKENVLNEAEKRLLTLCEVNFLNIAKELGHLDPYQYARAYFPGLQEFVEAFTFFEYLSGRKMSDWKCLQEKLNYQVKSENEGEAEDPKDIKEVSCLVQPVEFILGLADTSGEVMRKCINSLGSGDIDSCFESCRIMQSLYARLNGTMNLLRKMQGKFFAQQVAKFCKRTMTSNRLSLIGESLNDKTLIKIQGSEVIPYLQGLITNDMTNFSRGSNIIYTMLLNNSGRVMYDTLIYRTGEPDVFLVECDKLVMNEVKRHLRLYRVRRNIEVESVANEYTPWAVFYAPKKEDQEDAQPEKTCGEQKPKPKHKISGGGQQIILDLNNADFNTEEVITCQDPRLRALGFRVVMPKSYSFQQLSKLFCHQKLEESTPATCYKYLRYRLGIGEGVQDHPINKCFPLESNCDFLHGVSFNKGCYVGQELTARVYHTGVVRKRLMPLTLTRKVDEGTKTVQTVGGTVVGSIRGFENDACLALLRVEQVMKMPNLMIDGDPCKVIIPDWWPKELPKKHAAKKKQANV